MNSSEGEKKEDPKGGEMDEELGKGLLLLFLRSQQKHQNPKENQDDPVGEAMRKLKIVVAF